VLKCPRERGNSTAATSWSALRRRGPPRLDCGHGRRQHSGHHRVPLRRRRGGRGIDEHADHSSVPDLGVTFILSRTAWASDSCGIRRGHQTHRKGELYTHWDLTPIRACRTALLSTRLGSEAASAGFGLRISRSGVRIPPGAPYHIAVPGLTHPKMLGRKCQRLATAPDPSQMLRAGFVLDASSRPLIRPSSGVRPCGGQSHWASHCRCWFAIVSGRSAGRRTRTSHQELETCGSASIRQS